MLIFMNLDFTSKITLYSLNAQVFADYLKDKPAIKLSIVLSTLVQLAPVAFFITAILLNLDNWIFMYFKIGRLVDQLKGRQYDSNKD